jgi:transcriptional regulator with XRE-family HTH domain
MGLKRLRLAQRRKAAGYSQEAFAEAVGVARTTVNRWECAESEPQPWQRPKIAGKLNISIEELEAVLADVVETNAATSRVAPAPRRRPPTPAEDPAEVSAIRGTDGFGGTHPDDVVTTAMHAFRVADSQIGGAALYSAVVAYLKSHVVPRLVDSADEADTSAAFSAAASMLEMAGWMAHDRGEDNAAQAHFSRALSFTRVGDDLHLRAHVLGSMSHLAAHLGRPHATVHLAQQGQDVLHGAPPQPPLMARLLALEARGAAGLGDSTRPLDLLARAETELGRAASPSPPPSPWVSHYDEASLASDAGRCLRRLGDLAETRRQAERIVGLRPPLRARSRGLGQLMLANVLVAQGVVDEASAVVERALQSSLPLHSAPVARSLRSVRLALAPHRASIAVADLHARLTETLDQQPVHPDGSGSSWIGRRT